MLLCTRKRTKNVKEALWQDPKCFSPVWAKVLADDRPFGSQKESDSSNSERDTRVNHSFIQSISQPINKTSQFHMVQTHSNARPVGPGTDATRDPNQTSSTAPTSNAARVRTIVSRCRGRLTFLSAYPHLQIRSIKWANVSASSYSAFYALVRCGPSCAPEMDIFNYSCPWDFFPTSFENGHRILGYWTAGKPQ